MGQRLRLIVPKSSEVSFRLMLGACPFVKPPHHRAKREPIERAVSAPASEGLAEAPPPPAPLLVYYCLKRARIPSPESGRFRVLQLTGGSRLTLSFLNCGLRSHRLDGNGGQPYQRRYH